MQWRIGLQKQKSTKVPMKKVAVRHTKDGKGSGLFAMEDIEKDDYVIEYMEKIEYKRKENIYLMKINEINLWISGDKNGGPAQYMNHSCNPNCELVQLGVDGLPRMCFFFQEEYKE